ncbi:MAG: MGDG synthase family glycosyltransferase [Nocardioidaceae bacterium]
MILPTHTIGLVGIVSGSFGAGHDAAAHAIAEQLEGRGFATRIWDIVDLMPGPFGRALRAGYLRQIRSLPGSWRWLLHRLERDERLAGLIARAMNSASKPLLDIAEARPDRIVSTHPFASQALGQLRADGQLDIPVATYLTDMSVHSLWIHPSVDLHLGVHDLPSDEARRLGAGVTRTIRPAVPAAFSEIPTSAAAKADARSALGLPRDGRLALVTGGSCGIGRLAESAADIAATGQAVPVVLCGRNDRLLRRIRRSASAIGLGWTDNMPQVLTAADAVVQNSGGFTSLETLAAGLPILTYNCIAGHGETNAAALDRAGLASWVKDADDLAPALRRALSFGSPGERLDAAQPNLTVADAIFAASRLRSA